MIGVFLEAIILSIGLGYKYHVYRKERHLYNVRLIKELRQNEKFKDIINEQLSEKVEIASIQLKNISKQAEVYKIEQLETHYKSQINNLQLSSLLSQMNSHFIFNALNSIKLFVINNESKKAAHYLNKFSKLIRRILEASKIKNTTLDKELETMDLYMAIENIRFSNKIQYVKKIEASIHLASVKIPSLIIHPFIENAIWDGLSSKKENKKILISVYKKGKEFIVIDVEDNGIGRAAATKISSQKAINRGNRNLQTTKERLENFSKEFKNNYSLFYKDVVNEDNKIIGTRITLQLPLV
jgi:LytS/YehU family sensor histidine kinase